MRGWRWCLLVLLLFGMPTWATFQAAEQLHLDGRSIDLLMFPLDPWLEAHPKALPHSDIYSTGNSRGYVGRWEVRNHQLLLTGLTVYGAGEPRKMKGTAISLDGSPVETESEFRLFEKREILPQLFAGKSEVPATWFTGTLVAALESEGYIHYGPTPRRYVVLWVEQGQIGRRVELDEAQFEAFLRDRFKRYKRTPAYAQHLREAQAYADSEVPAEEHVYWDAREEFLAREF